MNKEVRKGLLRHKFVYHFLRILIGWLIAKIRNFSYTYKKIKGKPVLILANHNSDFDPLLMVISIALRASQTIITPSRILKLRQTL